MDLNGISCGGYSVGKNEVVFSLYDTDYNAVSALNKKTLIDNNVWGPPSEQPNYWERYEA